MDETLFKNFNNKLVGAFKEANDRVEKLKQKAYSTPEYLLPKGPFIRKGMDKDATIEALWQAYKNNGSESDPKNYDFVNHFLKGKLKGATEEDYAKINSAGNNALVNMVNGLYPEHLDEKSFKAFLNKEGMLEKMTGFIAVPMNEVLRNEPRFKDIAKDFSTFYKSDGTVDLEKVRNILFKDDIAAIKTAKEEQANQQKALEQQNQEDYSPDPSGDTGASLGTGFGSMSAPFEVEPLRQAPVWLTRDQEKSVADFIASRALQEYRK